MIISLVSDLHDNHPNWEKINNKLKALGIEQMLFLGDTCAPITTVLLAETFKGKIDHVFGNVDGDEFLTAQKTAKFDNITLHGREAELEIDGRKLFLVHYPIYAEYAAASGKYDYVFYGHDHQKAEKTINSTKLINPGTAGGVMYPASFATIDLNSGKVEFHEI